jgi:circadian clock protein KaiB
MTRFKLKLYVTGKTVRTACAVANLRRICEGELEGRVDWVVIDVLEQPQLAEEEKVMATPTLIKEAPLPFQRVIGDLSDRKGVLGGLNLLPKAQLEKGEGVQ